MEYERNYWLNEDSRTFLSRGYIKESPEQRIKDVANTAEKYLKIEGFAKKFEDYMMRGFYSLSTPVWINFGKDKGLPVSCYGSNVDDTLDSILNGSREIGMMSKYGGGTSVFLGNIRARGTKISTGGTADGPVHYARMYDTTVDVCKQSEARRGACAAWLPIEHSDILEFLDIGTEGNPIQNLHGSYSSINNKNNILSATSGSGSFQNYLLRENINDPLFEDFTNIKMFFHNINRFKIITVGIVIQSRFKADTL